MSGRLRAMAAGVVLGGVLLGGCATVKSTPAQDLARDRLSRCDRFPSVSLRDLAPDGSMTVNTYGTGAVGEYPAWRGCMENALAEQKKQGKVPPDAQPAIIEQHMR